MLSQLFIMLYYGIIFFRKYSFIRSTVMIFDLFTVLLVQYSTTGMAFFILYTLAIMAVFYQQHLLEKGALIRSMIHSTKSGVHLRNKFISIVFQQSWNLFQIEHFSMFKFACKYNCCVFSPIMSFLFVCTIGSNICILSLLIFRTLTIANQILFLSYISLHISGMILIGFPVIHITKSLIHCIKWIFYLQMVFIANRRSWNHQKMNAVNLMEFLNRKNLCIFTVGPMGGISQYRYFKVLFIIKIVVHN